MNVVVSLDYLFYSKNYLILIILPRKIEHFLRQYKYFLHFISKTTCSRFNVIKLNKNNQ
jgi:hypothetical protein